MDLNEIERIENARSRAWAVSICDKVGKKGLTEKWCLSQDFKEVKKVSNIDMRRENVPGRGKKQWKGSNCF